MRKIWVILGFGNSGKAAYDFLLNRDNDEKIYTIDDKKQQIPNKIKNIEEFFHSNHSKIKLIVSPGVSPKNPIIVQSLKKNIPVFTELDLVLPNFRGKIIAITGTNGKSTTASMVSHLLSKQGVQHQIGGNFGKPACEMAKQALDDDFWILELSSFQLHYLNNISFAANAFTNIASDHLQWHGSFKNYLADKLNIFKNGNKNQINLIDQDVVLKAKAHNLQLPSSYEVIDKKSLEPFKKKLGFSLFNTKNACLAHRLVSSILKRPVSVFELSDYKFLSHRYETVKTFGQWSIINDSKSTNLDSCIQAIENATGKMTVFIGGQSKGESFSSILNYSDKIGVVVAFGNNSRFIYDSLSSKIHVILYKTLNDAMKNLKSLLNKSKGDIVFSPGCPSYDEFSNFEERGDFFKNNVFDVLPS